MEFEPYVMTCMIQHAYVGYFSRAHCINVFLIVFLLLTACTKGRKHFCVNILALAAYYAAYLLVQPLMNVVRCSLFNFVIICEPMR